MQETGKIPDANAVNFPRAFVKAVIVWNALVLIDAFSVSPYPTGVWIYGTLGLAMIFTILLESFWEFLLGIAIAAYSAYFNWQAGLVVLAYLVFSLYRLERKKQEASAASANAPDLTGTKYAGVFRRAMAFTIDAAIFTMLLLPFSTAVGGLAEGSDPLNPHYRVINITLCLLAWSVLSVSESYAGATLGKMALRLTVAREEGGNLSIRDALVRNFIKFPLWVIPIYLFHDIGMSAVAFTAGQLLCFLTMILTNRNQALYDLLSHAVVIHHSYEAYKEPKKMIIT